MIESFHFPHEKAESQSGEAGLLWFSLGLVPSQALVRPAYLGAHSVLGTCAFLCLPLFDSQLIDLRTQSRLKSRSPASESWVSLTFILQRG